MITISIHLDSNGVIKDVKITGHAKDSENGICNAISILSQTLYLSLLNIPDLNFNYKDDGSIFIIDDIRCEDIFVSELRGVSMFFIVGLEAINKDNNSIKLEIFKGE